MASMAMVAVKPEVTALSDDEPVDPGVVQPPPLQLAPVEKKKTKNNPCATQRAVGQAAQFPMRVCPSSKGNGSELLQTVSG